MRFRARQAWGCFFAQYWWDRFPLPLFVGEYLYDSANLGASLNSPLPVKHHTRLDRGRAQPPAVPSSSGLRYALFGHPLA